MRKILLAITLIVSACVEPLAPVETVCTNQPMAEATTLKFIPTIQEDGTEAPGRGTIITVQDRFLEPHRDVLVFHVSGRDGGSAFDIRYMNDRGKCFTLVDSLHIRDWYTVTP